MDRLRHRPAWPGGRNSRNDQRRGCPQAQAASRGISHGHRCSPRCAAPKRAASSRSSPTLMRRSLGSPRGTRASAGRPTTGPSLSASGGTADAASHVRRLTQLRSPSAAGTSRSAMSPVGNCRPGKQGKSVSPTRRCATATSTTTTRTPPVRRRQVPHPVTSAGSTTRDTSTPLHHRMHLHHHTRLGHVHLGRGI
jgi:hypothetical protein